MQGQRQHDPCVITLPPHQFKTLQRTPSIGARALRGSFWSDDRFRVPRPALAAITVGHELPLGTGRFPAESRVDNGRRRCACLPTPPMSH
jgi:hypothetical protein